MIEVGASKKFWRANYFYKIVSVQGQEFVIKTRYVKKTINNDHGQEHKSIQISRWLCV